MTLIAVPITVESAAQTLRDAVLAAELGADLVELRIDSIFDGSSDDDAADRMVVAEIEQALSNSPLPVILTCRHASEGGDYDGDETNRVSLLEHLCTGPAAPAYLDFELARYTASANIRQKVNLCVQHPSQQRDVTARLILSTHDFEGRPADLSRRLAAMYAEPACAIAKVAYRCRSLRDNLELFDILDEAPKPAIALGMGEFGLMSRVLAPKFGPPGKNGGAFLTFASLRDSAATAPGQPTIQDLLGRCRFRSISKSTKLYGVIGWPVTQSMSPVIHNAGFDTADHDGVYLPLPIAAGDDQDASRASFNATVAELWNHPRLDFVGGSVTIPHKEHAAAFGESSADTAAGRLDPRKIGAANTLYTAGENKPGLTANSDATAILDLLSQSLGDLNGKNIAVIGAGGVAKAAAAVVVSAGATAVIYNRTAERAERLAADVNESIVDNARNDSAGKAVAASLDLLPKACCEAFINCTPIGMTGGPDPDGLSIPIPDMKNATESTVFFDTVYNPIETPMLAAAKARGCRTIDGVQMFVRQAAAQFELWTGSPAPTETFDALVRDALSAGQR